MKPTYAEVQQLLLARWPETKLEPSLERIAQLCDMLGNPQDSFDSFQLTGTNGKTSTARMIDALMRARGLRTGRFSSPHLQRMNERISIDGEPIDDDAFVDAYADVAVYADLVDSSNEHPLSFFEMTVAMAYAAFADTPIDVGIVEVGMGGQWDATNVLNADIALVGPIGVDHERYLGDDPVSIAEEKAGIIKPGTGVVMAAQDPDVAGVIAGRALELGVRLVREGVDFGVESRLAAVGGQQVSFQGLGGRYEDILIPLHGAHQARNAANAIAAVELFTGGHELDRDIIAEAFAEVTSPGRLEVVRRGPSVVLDAAHNAHGAQALVEAISEEFTFSPLIVVMGVMADKDVEAILHVLEPITAHLICTRNSTDRSMPPARLADIAGDILSQDRVHRVDRLDDALEMAIQLAETAPGFEDAVGSGGVLVTGSVVTVGEARTLLKGDDA